MSPILIVLLVLGGLAVLIASTALVSMLQRRDVMLRASDDVVLDPSSVVLRPEKETDGVQERIKARLESWAKTREESEELQHKLIQAGFESATAPAIYFLFRVSSMVLLPVTALIVIPRTAFTIFVMTLGLGAFIGMILPVAMLDRLVRLRQDRIKRSVPDALDLLVVCVEAGTSLDAAILRVAKELRLAHPDLAHELAVVNRLTNAGMPRDEALRGLWKRTGVLDIRALVSSLIQSEKWGTSIATVLRVSAETLRRKRRQDAEKRAKMAPLKMTFPLLFFILPALFAVILGPAVVQIIKEFGKI
jgi:tight adherence protein C